MCASLNEILGSITGMTGGDNETQDEFMDMMQKMMSGGDLDGMDNNMTEGVDLQHVMNMQFCSLMTDEKMMEEMQ